MEDQNSRFPCLFPTLEYQKYVVERFTLTKAETLLCVANLFNRRNFEGLEISAYHRRFVVGDMCEGVSMGPTMHSCQRNED